MTNPNDSFTQRPGFALAMRIVSGFLLAALATYIPMAAVGVYVLWELRVHPPPADAVVGIDGGSLLVFIIGPFCSLVAGIVGAFLGAYRFHLGWMAFYILIGESLTIAAIWFSGIG